MDNLSQSLSSSSWENPFGISGNIMQCDLESGEQFVGEELKAFFDKEEKMYQSTSSMRSDQSNQTGKSNAMASGITIRSFMVESGDSDLIHQKLTMSQYLAYKSEPMGPELGDSASFKERPYFSFQEKSLQSPHSEKSEPGVAEFNPDFSQEPSWMKKKSLSSLSSSENLEIPSKSPDSSENWLIGKNKSESQNSMVDNIEKSSASLDKKKSNIQYSEAPMPEPIQPATRLSLHQACEISELPSLYWKPHDESLIDNGHSHLEPAFMKAAISNCHSYVAGHVESLSHESDGSRRPSEMAASSQSSSSPASTIRENTDFPRCESLISEPQLSSTREITDSYIDVSSSEKRVHFRSDSSHAEISHISIEKQKLQLESLLEVSSKPNLCSTAMTPTAKASEHVMRILANLSQRANSSVDQERQSQQLTPRLHDKIDVETESKNLNLEWERIERELTQHDPNGFSPESWVAVFSNTSCLSTPLLMNKIKEHVLRLNGRGMSSGLLPSESSGIGGSGFEITESRGESACGLPSNRSAANSTHPSLAQEKDISSRASSSNMNPTQYRSVESSQHPTTPVMPASAVKIEEKFLKNRHTLSAMPARDTIKHELPTPIDGLAKREFNHIDYARLTSTAIKTIPATNVARSSPATQSKVNSAEIQQSLQAPLIKCNKSQVYFGGSKIRQTQKQNVVIRNSSFEEALELELRIKDSEDFYMLNENSSLVSSHNFRLEPRQECCLDLVFQPQTLGPLASKLNLYPRCQSAKKVKYTVDLFGYGGSSIIQQLTNNASESERMLVPKSKGTHWNSQLVLKNRGNVAGFAFIQPLQDNGKVMEANQCIVMPQCFSLNAGDVKEIQILIHPTEEGKLVTFKLRLVWGDEPLRIRWMRCIANGSPVKPASEIVGFDWTRLLQLEPNDKSTKPPVGEEDMALFLKNITVDEMKVIVPDRGQDSHFVTLAVEPATVLESSTVNDTMLSERRLTNAVSGKMTSDMTVSAAVTELAFPSTKVGTISSQKIPLQNWSGTKQEVRVKEISGPFIMKHTRNAVPGGYFTRLPIQFHPTKIGPHSGSVLLDVGQHGQTIMISLKGDAF